MKILMTESLQPVGQAIFNDHPDVELVTPSALTEEALIEAVQGVHGIAVRSAKLTPAVLAAATELRAVSRHGVGYDNIDVPTLNARGIPLLLAIHANAVSVAEHVMYFMLHLGKRAPIYEQSVRDSNFGLRSNPIAIDLAEKVLTIVGFGRIGTRLATRARAFDMDVRVYDPYVEDTVIQAAGCTPVTTLSDVLPNTLFLSVHCPLNSETRGIVSQAELDLLPKNSFVINCARGGIVDEVALADALHTGNIAGAGVDVFTEEPLPIDHPLLKTPNTVLSPHSAGVSIEAAQRMSRETAENLLGALGGNLDPATLANPEVLR